MRYQELNALLSDITGVCEAAITTDSQLGEMGIDEEGYSKIAEEIGGEADAEYIACISSVGDLLDYSNGE